MRASTCAGRFVHLRDIQGFYPTFFSPDGIIVYNMITTCHRPFFFRDTVRRSAGDRAEYSASSALLGGRGAHYTGRYAERTAEYARGSYSQRRERLRDTRFILRRNTGGKNKYNSTLAGWRGFHAPAETLSCRTMPRQPSSCRTISCRLITRQPLTCQPMTRRTSSCRP